MSTALELLADKAAFLWMGARNGERSMSRALRCATLLGDLDISDVDVSVMDRLSEQLQGEGLGPASINRHLSALSKLLRWAEARGGIGKAPKAPFRREPRGRSRVLSSEETTKVLSWFDQNAARPYRAFICFLLETGLRCGEAHSLRWEDVSKDRSARYWVTPKDTKNGDPRSVPLSRAAYQAMKTACAPDQVFAKVNRNTLSHLWAACRNELALDRELVIHSLRHSRASILVNAGVPIAHIQAWLGHRDIKTTMRYAHTDRASLARALEAMEGKDRKDA